jgi:adenosylcobinamide hydrolase
MLIDHLGTERALVVDLGVPHRALSSAVLGGGLTTVRTWLNLQVEPDYARTDPDEHLRGVAAALGLASPVAGMLTAADTGSFTRGRRPLAEVVATVGIGHPLAAAGRTPRPAPHAGTINLLVRCEAPLTDAALVAAVQTATEAKAQALADAGVRAGNHDGPATGTATDSVLVVCPPGAIEPFAGPATRHGAELAAAVHDAVLAACTRGLSVAPRRPSRPRAL